MNKILPLSATGTNVTNTSSSLPIPPFFSSHHPTNVMINPFRSEKRVPPLTETLLLWATGLPILRIIILVSTLIVMALYIILVALLLSILQGCGYTIVSNLYTRVFVLCLYPVHFACRTVLWCFGIWYIRTESVTFSSPSSSLSSSSSSSSSWLSFPKEAFTVTSSSSSSSSRLDKRAPIIIATHHTILDAFYIGWICIPTPVAKASLVHVPLLGRAFQTLQPILVPRTTEERNRLPSVLDQIHTKVQHFFELNQQPFVSSSVVSPIIIFPEGTTASCRTILFFQRGAFSPGVPVTPIIISYGDDKVSAETMPDESTVSSMVYRLLFRTFYTPMKVTYLPVYIPNTEEINDPSLYANNVRQLIATIANRTCVPLSDRDGLLYTKCCLYSAKYFLQRYTDQQKNEWNRYYPGTSIVQHFPEWVYHNISLPLGTREMEQLLNLSLHLTTVVNILMRIYESIYLAEMSGNRNDNTDNDGNDSEGWRTTVTVPFVSSSSPSIDCIDEHSVLNLFDHALDPWIGKGINEIRSTDVDTDHPVSILPWYITSSVQRYAHRTSIEVAHTPRSRIVPILSKPYVCELYRTVLSIIKELRKYYTPILEHTLRTSGNPDERRSNPFSLSSSSVSVLDLVMLFALLRHPDVNSFNDILHRICLPYCTIVSSDRSIINPLDTTNSVKTNDETNSRKRNEYPTTTVSPILTETEIVTESMVPNIGNSQTTLEYIAVLNGSSFNVSSASSLSSISSHPKSISMSGFGTSLIEPSVSLLNENGIDDEDNESSNLTYAVTYSAPVSPVGNISTLVTTSNASTVQADDSSLLSSTGSKDGISPWDSLVTPSHSTWTRISALQWQYLRARFIASLFSFYQPKFITLNDIELFTTIDQLVQNVRTKTMVNNNYSNTTATTTAATSFTERPSIFPVLSTPDLPRLFTALLSFQSSRSGESLVSEPPSATDKSTNNSLRPFLRSITSDKEEEKVSGDIFVEFMVKNNRNDLIDTGIRILDYGLVNAPYVRRFTAGSK